LASIIDKYKTLLSFAEAYNIEGAIFFVDFTKAFDSLEWTTFWF
jgi:hypothetical protein